MTDYPSRARHPEEIEHFVDKAIESVSELEFIHESVATPSTITKLSQAPANTLVGNSTPGLEFTKDTDAAARIFRVPPGYVPGSGSFHIHWSKSTDTNDLGKTVRWRVSINISSHGNDADLTDPPIVFEVEDSYPDSDTTGRIFVTTDHILFNGLLEDGKYISMKVEAITPLEGTALSEPVLISIDFTYHKFIHLV